MNNLVKENIKISLLSIRSHLLRTILTILIIAFGIMALVGILTAIDTIKYYLNDNFTMMGANTLTIRKRQMHMHMGNHSSNPKLYKSISYEDATNFKERYEFPSAVSIFIFASHTATVKYASVKSNPNIPVAGADENYLITSGNEIVKGRNFTPSEVYYGSNVVIVGSEIISTLFNNKNADAVDKIISIGAGKYKIIGVLKEKGSSIGFSSDKMCIISLNNVRQYFSKPDMSYSINITVNDPKNMEMAEGEAMSLFSVIRKVKPGSEISFDISKSDNLAKMLFENLKYLRLAATIIGLITLVGAAIGLMNIMLVSVKERTQEIGIRKAIGAKKRTIKRQFLIEAIVIAQLGGILGIFFGIIIGNSISLMIGSKFIIPWIWIISGVVLCFIVALISGIVPATKAANLDPIEALRYE
jgi:putative ABC transport system permease protein